MASNRGTGPFAAGVVVIFLAGCSGEPLVGTQEDALEIEMGANKLAELGQGWDLPAEERRGACLRSDPPVILNGQHAVLTFGNSLSKTDASNVFGFEVNAKARFGLASADARAKFSRSLTTNSLAISMYYATDIVTGTQKIDQARLTWLVDPQTTSTNNWYVQCGDMFLWQKDLGGQLFMLYRIDFSSESARQEFEAAVGVSWPMGEVNAKVTANASRFEGRAAVHVEAYQYGGDVTRLSSILGGTASDTSTSAARVILDCSMTNLAPCGQFLERAITYASSQDAGAFSVTVGQRPADRRYTYKDWTMLGVNAPVRSIGAEVGTARFGLQQRFDKQIEIQERVTALKSGRLFVPPQLRSQLDAFELVVQRNILLIQDAVRACYDNLTNPQDPSQIGACVSAASEAALVSRGYDTTLTMDRFTVDVRLPYVFGGMFQVDNACSCSGITIRCAIECAIGRPPATNIANPFTGALTCPGGFAAFPIGKVVKAGSTYGGWTASQYLCLAPQGALEGWSFTGTFQTDDAGTGANTVNILNYFGGSGLACPSGSTTMRYGRAVGPESGSGVNQFFCTTLVKSTERMPFGGMYQQNDSACAGGAVNPVTGTYACPEGFSPVLRGRAKYNPSCGANQYVCKMY